MNAKVEIVSTLSGMGFSYESVFRNTMVGQIIVSENLSLIAANNRMFEYLNLKPCEVDGSLFGCAFHCANCDAGQSCGQNLKCRDCRIRNAVDDIKLNHIAIKDANVHFTVKNGNRRKVRWFQMSGVELPENSYVLLTFSDVTELKSQGEQLRKLLALDLATGTMNKYSLIDTIQRMIDPEANVAGFTVVMMDFDNFKEINDQYGHLIGDKVLEAFSDISRRHIRKKDILGRYGGEEFIFIFPDTDQRQALKILKRIHNELFNHPIDDLFLSVTFSAGIIYVQSDSNLHVYDDLIGAVDKRLYRAKKHGRNRIVCDQGEILF